MMKLFRPMLACLFICAIANAQTPVFPEWITTDDGLSQGFITSIVQDGEGFIWIGAKNGLNRYDGEHFEIFENNLNDPYSISNDFIRAIHDDDEDGRLNYSGVLSDVPSIRSQVFNDPNNSVFGGPPVASYPSQGYHGTDVDMNGVTVYSGATSDVLYIRNDIFNNPSNSVSGGPPTSTYVFVQQLPEGAN